MARALSSERLAKLYADTRPYAGTQLNHQPAPVEFRDLRPVLLKSYGDDLVIVRLRGCMDHHIDLAVYGDRDFAGRSQQARIELWWGEHPTQTEVLWRQ
jgi:hypothetical protein